MALRVPDQDHELEIFAMRRFEGDLIEHNASVLRMVEGPFAAFAFEDVL